MPTKRRNRDDTNYDTAFGKTIRQIVQPILAPFRRLNLVFAGIDFSIIAII
uniref:YggT family protein n=1 Tax=Alistipes shahii TaxID=328814 RepID=UPI003FEEA6AD